MLFLRDRTVPPYQIAASQIPGGSFQNMYLMARLPRRLENEGFRVLRNRRVSTNDEGLSLGQLMIAEAALHGSLNAGG